LPEYTIKLDIDSTELGRKLKASLKQALTQAIGGSQGSMGLIMGSGSMKSPILRNLIKEQTGLLEVQQIKLIRAIEKADERQKQGFLGKFGPGLVKLAGFSIGMAGLMQFRKMLIDSSPMLQAMLKIMNTSFMLVLRPFGDFLGFFLMPMVMGMLQFAIPFYRMMSKEYPAFIEAGQKFWSGDLSGSWEAIANALERLGGAGTVGGATFGGIVGGPAGGLLGLLFGADFVEWWDAQMKKIPYEFGGAQTAYACPGSTISREEQIKNAEKAMEDIYPWLKTGGAGAGTTGFQQLEREIAMADQLKLEQTNLSLEHIEDATCGFDNIQEIINAIAEGTMPEIDRQTLEMLRHIRNAKISGRNMSDTMLDTANAFRATYDTVLSILARLARVRKISGGNLTPQAKAAQAAIDVEPAIVIQGNYENARATLSGAYSYNIKRGEFAYQGINPHLFGTAGMAASTGVLNIWRKFSNVQIQGLRDQGAIKFAKGGILREPVFGVGASGQTYQFAERGPETISPTGGEGTTILTFNVYGMGDVHEFESKVKPMVMRWLKESKSNRGIL